MRLFLIALAVAYVTMVGLAQTFSFDVFSGPMQSNMMQSTISTHGMASTPSLDSGVFTQIDARQPCGTAQNDGKLESAQCVEE